MLISGLNDDWQEKGDVLEIQVSKNIKKIEF